MKTILYLFIFSTIFSCGSNADKTEEKTEPVTVQEPVVNQEPQKPEPIVEKPVQKTMLVGEIEKTDLMDPPFSSWFAPRYDSFAPADAEMAIIKENISDVDNIKIFMGTWCGDSKREVPHFYKILELADYDLDNVEIVAVDHSKTTPDNLQEGFNIHHVPTFIFYKDGKEVNRFVEHPRESLEKDIAKIVSGQEYKDSYSN